MATTHRTSPPELNADDLHDSATLQLLVRLRASQDCAHESQYHRKIRGRLQRPLVDADGTLDETDTQNAPFTFSNVLPYQHTYDEGDECHLLVSARNPDALRTIAQSFADEPRLTAGSMVFDIRAARPIPADVGPPGESGTITTSSGIIATVDRGPDSEYSQPTYWSDRDHTLAEFRHAVNENVAAHCEHVHDTDPPKADLFETYNHHKTYAVDLEPTANSGPVTVIVSKWNLRFEVRSDHHRDLLNRTLAYGVGSKRSYGFGCLQTKYATFDPSLPDGEG